MSFSVFYFFSEATSLNPVKLILLMRSFHTGCQTDFHVWAAEDERQRCLYTPDVLVAFNTNLINSFPSGC